MFVNKWEINVWLNDEQIIPFFLGQVAIFRFWLSCRLSRFWFRCFRVFCWNTLHWFLGDFLLVSFIEFLASATDGFFAALVFSQIRPFDYTFGFYIFFASPVPKRRRPLVCTGWLSDRAYRKSPIWTSLKQLFLRIALRYFLLKDANFRTSTL